VTAGATVMAHVSMNEVKRTAPAVDALGLVGLFKELLTPDGVLLVVTSPFLGLEADYVATHPTFDSRRTPSRMGLMTELFRRMPDTRRSLHPTHAVAGWGADVDALLATHHEGETFAETSPFCLMRERSGIVVGLGVGVKNAFTVIHSGEYLHPRAREFAFATESSRITLRDEDRTIDYSFRPLRAGVVRRVGKIERGLRSAGVVTYARHSGLLISSASATNFIEGTKRLISGGTFYSQTLP
jgi:aminoglycoside N3'-acetyltransferase